MPNCGLGVKVETTTGYGVVGSATAANGTGVVGTALTTGVQGQTANGRGVVGLGTQAGVGVYGESVSGLGGSFKTNATAVATAALKAQAIVGGTAIWGHNPGGTAAWLDGDVYAGSYQSTSDGRLKKDVRDISYGLDHMLELRPVTFKWKRDNDGQTHLGFIAQEVENVIPEVVSYAHDPSGSDVMTVNYTELVPILIKAVQQQNRIIVEQENRLVALERARPSLKVSSMIGGGVLGLVSLGLVLASRHRKGQHGPVSREPE